MAPMAALTSLTPSSYPHSRIPLSPNASPIAMRATSMRQNHQVNAMRRSPSVPQSLRRGGTAANGHNAQLDSSDDEGDAPALSAAAEELLGGRSSQRKVSTAVTRTVEGDRQAPLQGRVAATGLHGHLAENAARLNSVDQSLLPSSRSPKVVRISRNSPKRLDRFQRTASTSSAADGSPIAIRNEKSLRTPAPRPKSALGTSAMSSQIMSSFGKGESGRVEALSENHGSGLNGSLSPREGEIIGNKVKSEESGPQNSIRIKRVGKVQGRFLSGPARRGVIRRHSEEDHSPIRPRDIEAISQMEQLDQGGSIATHAGPTEDQLLVSNNSDRVHVSGDRVMVEEDGGSNVRQEQSKSGHQYARPAGDSPASGNMKVEASNVHPSHEIAISKREPHRVPQTQLPSLHDQENEPPPNFKHHKATDHVSAHGQTGGKVKYVQQAPVTNSPRRALAPRSQNTPQRPAPPPPKMSMLETATATAGAASTTQRRLKRQYISLNGKTFTKMECIGRGGSGRVYRVMAENYKHFALKRVSLEEVDQAAIRGFKGEIDLLRKLENVDRVVRIYDFEINDEKKSLSVLMDLGELDLKKILDPRLDEETGYFDVTFTRYIWKEMLECVQAIHAHDVVHSDLKPANFVSAQGRLKLIDFGIANAIQDDTVNVHREQQIGTPNYMAPEALLDTNALAGRRSNLGKLMKLGKPSDVWSLACILYQIVYGKPPFGHIPNPMNKVIAITDASHVITFPEVGVGKAPVPSGLIRTLRRCLNRDPSLRPTIPELLSERDPFLHPDAAGSIPINTEHLKAIQHNVLRIIEAHGMPDAEGKPKDEAVRQWLDHWGPQLFTSMKASLERAVTS